MVKRRARGVPVALSAALALVASAAPAAGTPPGSLRVPGPIGTVDTVAGPGFCPKDISRPDASSTEVGAVAADSGGTGQLWFEAGPVGAGLLAAVANGAAITVSRSGAEVPAGSPDLAAASRLADDGRGGVFIVARTAIVQIGEGLTTLAGRPSAATVGGDDVAASGDGGPLAEATFGGIAAIVTDGPGNVYVADRVDARTDAVTIRFLNRGDEPVTFYGGTPAARTVAAGTIATIAGGDAAPAGPDLLAVAPSLAVGQNRLYLSGQTSAGSAATVRMLNLGTGPLSLHGVTVAAGAIATVATVNGATGAGLVSDAAPVSPVPGIAADTDDNLYLVEQMNHRVRRVDRSGRVSTFAGTGAPGFNGNDLPAVQARLDRPYDVDVGPGGRVYISDAGNRQLRMVDRAGVIRAAPGNGANLQGVCEAMPTSPTDRSAAGTTRDLPQPGHPTSLASDPAGNVYLTTSSMAQVHRLAPSGGLSPAVGRPAGACREAGCAVEEGAPEAVDVSAVMGVAVRPGGGLYIQDGSLPRRQGEQGASRVRFLNLSSTPVRVHGVDVPAGQVRRVAGDLSAAVGAVPFGGGRALDVRIQPSGAGALAAGRDGSLFIADALAGVVWQVDAGGTITTALPGRSAEAEGGAPVCCGLPVNLETDPEDNLYISDAVDNRVWFLNRSSTIAVVHGLSVPPGSAQPVAGAPGSVPRRGILLGSQDEGVPARNAQLSPGALATDRSGNLYLSDSQAHVVRRVDLAGLITTVAGIGQASFNGDGMKALVTGLHQPSDVAVDVCGNLLIADTANDRVRRVNLVDSCSSLAPQAAESGRGWPGAAATVALVALILAAGLALLGRRQRRGARAMTVTRRVGRWDHRVASLRSTGHRRLWGSGRYETAGARAAQQGATGRTMTTAAPSEPRVE